MATKKQEKAAKAATGKPLKKRVSIMMDQEDLEYIQKACEPGKFTVPEFFRRAAMILASGEHHVMKTGKKPVPCIKCGCKDILYVYDSKPGGKKDADGNAEKHPYIKCTNCGVTTIDRPPGGIPFDSDAGEWFFCDYMMRLLKNEVIGDWNRTNKKPRKK